ITAAMRAGAQDLVSAGHTQRLCAVAEREFRAQRRERALNETLDSASAYRKQLISLKASSEDAIACSQEGVLVEANQAWALLFGRADPSELHGQPIMDLFELSSRATLKGGLIACESGRWDNDLLRVTALTEDGTTPAIELWLEKTVYDDGPAIQLRVRNAKAPASEPRQLVEETVHRDPITGFYHRRHFIDMLKQRLESNPRGGVRVLAYLRPDRFGEIKDDIGPLASEDVLVQLAEVVRGLTQPNDLYGRFGGVVFAVLLERGTLRDVEAWADNAITTISDHLFEIGEKTVSVTCTLGLSEVTRGADRIESIVIEAEQANNRGRQRGGNQVVLAEISDESTRIRRFDLEWVERIKAALLNDRFRLVHLPIVSLSGQEGARFDTVMRMLDELGDEVPAGEFMPAAERHGMLKMLDRWVIGSSIAYAAEHTPDTLFIKLSKDSVIDPTLLEWLDSEIESKNVDAGAICFQVSEEIANRHLKQVKQLVAELSSRGFAFAVEHFGVCRDPMRILNNVPMDFLKIDGSLMQSISSNQTRQEEVQNFSSTARDKGIATIAERIEDANSMAVLFQLGIGFMQGHYVQEAEVVLEEPAARAPITLGDKPAPESSEAAPAEQPSQAAAAPEPEAEKRSEPDTASKRKVVTNAGAAPNIEHDTTRGPQLTVEPGAGDGLELELESEAPDAAVGGDSQALG
ncbi:MAG TPA: EAL domain-containing protein, partial [Gammaproteobacteria bacterium]